MKSSQTVSHAQTGPLPVTDISHGHVCTHRVITEFMGAQKREGQGYGDTVTNLVGPAS